MKAGDAVTGVVTSIAAKLSAPAMSLHMRISFATINARFAPSKEKARVRGQDKDSGLLSTSEGTA
jgi:hypothetical protein